MSKTNLDPGQRLTKFGNESRSARFGMDDQASLNQALTVLVATRYCRVQRAPQGENIKHMLDPDVIMNRIPWPCSQEQDGQAICTATPRDPRPRVEPSNHVALQADEVWDARHPDKALHAAASQPASQETSNWKAKAK